MIILVNERLANSWEISNLYLSSENSKKSEIKLSYVPGVLKIDLLAIKKLFDSTDSLILRIPYIEFFNGVKSESMYFAKFKYDLFEKQYLILNVYDFKEERFRIWYKRSSENFITEFKYPGSPVLVKNRK